MGRKKSGLLHLLKSKFRGGSAVDVAAGTEADEDEEEDPLQQLLRDDLSEMRRQELIEAELAHELHVAFDTYSKGLTSIPAREVGYILRSLGQNPTEDDILNFVCEAGCTWDGYLTRDDFVAVGVVAMHRQANRLDDVRAAFRAFDHNNDGSISKDELRGAMTRYGHIFSVEECDEMFKEADVNGDGTIDFDEFLAIMMHDHASINYANASTDQ